MALIKQNNPQANWHEVLGTWERVANWVRFKTSQSEFDRQIKSLLIFLWNEKDWLKSQYPEKKHSIESYITESVFICIVGDLANTTKHRELTRPPRSQASQTNYFGRVTLGKGETRQMHFINDGKGGHPEIIEILRGAIDEFEKLHILLASGQL